MYGRALLRRGGVAFDELKQAIRDIEFLANPNVGEVRIGCPETIAVILPPVIEQLSRRYPDVVPIVVGEVASPSMEFSELQARKSISSCRDCSRHSFRPNFRMT